MRRLAQLFLAMKQKAVPAVDFTFAQMFSCRHFASLEESIEELTETEEDQGHSIRTGLKLGLRYLIPHAANITQGFMLMDRQTDRSAEVDGFLKVFNLRRDYIFSDAEYQACNSRLAKLRRPEQLPKSDDLQLFKSFLSAQLVKFTGDPYHLWGSNDFVMLRDILVARLTLFNARRGGEPCRLLLNEWRDVEKGVWVDNSAAGKGNHHAVSTLIPKDTVEGLNMIASENVRMQAGVETENPFLFQNVSCLRAISLKCFDRCPQCGAKTHKEKLDVGSNGTLKVNYNCRKGHACTWYSQTLLNAAALRDPLEQLSQSNGLLASVRERMRFPDWDWSALAKNPWQHHPRRFPWCNREIRVTPSNNRFSRVKNG